MTERAAGGIVSVGQPVVLGEHGCSLAMPPRARRGISGSFRIELPADSLAVLEKLAGALGTSPNDEAEESE